MGNEANKGNRSKVRRYNSKGGGSLFTPLFGEHGNNEVHPDNEAASPQKDDAGNFDGRGGSIDGSEGQDNGRFPNKPNGTIDERVSVSYK